MLRCFPFLYNLPTEVFTHDNLASLTELWAPWAMSELTLAWHLWWLSRNFCRSGLTFLAGDSIVKMRQAYSPAHEPSRDPLWAGCCLGSLGSWWLPCLSGTSGSCPWPLVVNHSCLFWPRRFFLRGKEWFGVPSRPVSGFPFSVFG